MARVLGAAALVLAAMGTAYAGHTRKVQVESDPPGATVYLNDPSEGALCETPCTIDAPIGETPIILQREGYEPVFDNLVVSRRGKTPVARFTLVSAVGTLVIKGAPDGATVSVDETDKGTTPDKIQVESGSHHIVVTFKSKKLFDDFIRVETGTDTEIVATASSADDLGPPDDGDGSGSDVQEEVHTKAPSGPRQRFINAGIEADVGFRRFSYVNPHPQGNLGLGPNSGESEDGQVVAGPAIELWPAELLRLGYLRGLSLFVRFQFGLNHQVLTTTDMSGAIVPAGAQTTWSSLEASIRHRWVIADTVAIEASGGFVRDVYGFQVDNEMIHTTVPDTDYKSLRLGARLSLTGTIAPYITAENRIVLSGGYFATQYMDAHASGLHGAAGMMIHAGALTAKIEGELTSYSWTFSAQDPNADGATDKVFGFAALLGYQY
jgi:hypothetical protein